MTPIHEMYIPILSAIAKDKGLHDLSNYISLFKPAKIADPVYVSSLTPTKKYNITVLPEATCEGCQ